MQKQLPYILLVDDDQNLATITSEYLEAKNLMVKVAHDAESGLELFKKEGFDLCLLDIKMPMKDGFSLAEDVRKINSSIPLIFLTGQIDKKDRIHGLELGADDYITKPFSMQELYLRITNLLRRVGYSGQSDPEVYLIGQYKFYEINRTLVIGSSTERLTEMEAQLLLLFLRQPKNRITRDEALENIWKDKVQLKSRSLSVYINKLRKRLSEDPDIEIINIYGTGYQLVK